MKNIHIEYCEKWNYKPEFDRVSKIILSIDKTINIAENNSSPRTGSFEVMLDNQLVFSKLEIEKFPNDSEIYSWLS